MSMELNLSIHDYKRLIGWFELAFAKRQNAISEEDNNTFRKISVMCLCALEEAEKDKHHDH